MKKLLAVGGTVAAFAVGLFLFSAAGMLTSNASQAQSGCTSTTGVLPGIVPEPYNSTFTAAAAQWKVPPALLAAIFESENGNSWPDANSPWPTSVKGAEGPFQFEPTTWVGYSNSNPNHPNGDILNLTDAAYAAAHYLSDLHASINMQPGSPKNPQAGTVAWVAGAYNGGKPLVGNSENDQYRVNTVQKFIEYGSGAFTNNGSSQPSLVAGNPAVPTASPGCTSPDGTIILSPNGYSSPFPVQPVITRAIDQGVDYQVPAGTPLRAIGDAKVMTVVPFYEGEPSLVYQLLNGSLAGKCIYYAEQIAGMPGLSASDQQSIAALQTEVGHVVQAGQTLAYYATAGTALEFGFADCGGNTLAHSTGGYKENDSTAAGVSFNKLMVALGVPSDSPYPVILGSVAGMGYP